jgi:uncharacterized membrane protein YhaH (DUF805 family)
MKSGIADGLRRWNDFSGRSSREQYWWFTGFFLALPLLLQIPLWVVLFIFAPGPGALLPFLILSYAWVILIPAQISNNARRLHDVGKSGWLMLVPIYNLYLYIQPSHEQGKMPFWHVIEKVALVFIFLPLLGLLEGDITTSFGGSITWLAIYLQLDGLTAKKKESYSKHLR